jgi:GNAT superfamily N-acetyltransferase
LVAEGDGKIVGFATSKIEKNPLVLRERYVGHVGAIFVKEEHRTKGIATGFITYILTWFKKRKIKKANLTLDTKNKIGRSLYSRLGFRSFQEKMQKNL